MPPVADVAQSVRAAAPPKVGRWAWSQEWRNVLFAHWPVDPATLARCVPPPLALDELEGEAWITAVLFELGVRHRLMPVWMPSLVFPELNLRTYVRWRDQPGIMFLSLHGGSRLAVELALRMTPLPYHYVRMEYRVSDTGCIFKAQKLLTAEFVHAPTSEAAPCGGGLDAWLLERYAAYVPSHSGQLKRMVVEHPPWEVVSAELSIDATGLGHLHALDLAGHPACCHFASGFAATISPFELIGPLRQWSV